jgi:hypothetical protein
MTIKPNARNPKNPLAKIPSNAFHKMTLHPCRRIPNKLIMPDARLLKQNPKRNILNLVLVWKWQRIETVVWPLHVENPECESCRQKWGNQTIPSSDAKK